MTPNPHFEAYHPDEQRWRTVTPGYVNAFLRAGPGDAVAMLARLDAGKTLNFNGWRLRKRGQGVRVRPPSTAPDSTRALHRETELISLGHRTGLLSRLADGVPVTSEALARACDLDERYVREWLGGLTVAGVLEHDPKAMTYRLRRNTATC